MAGNHTPNEQSRIKRRADWYLDDADDWEFEDTDGAPLRMGTGGYEFEMITFTHLRGWRRWRAWARIIRRRVHLAWRALCGDECEHEF